ncbi:uncharacterized protein [Arachis hypogaea]|uniref:uncharacterized protein n=1 Tax=Arachis hypogaea TaxID=3818 RepID=UPI003B20EE59
MEATPFYHSILEVRLPKHFDKPTNMRYDGTQDPQEHLTAFEARMNLEGVGDEVRCRAFFVTLTGPAIRWFNALLQGFVTTFADISCAFLAKFTTLYQQITNKGILSKPRQLKDRTEGNKNLYCDYHKGYGHKTQDFFDLKDALEQAIREGKLAEFSHLIRQPKRREHDRSGEDKSRAVRQRREPEEDNECGLTIVNVVIGRDVPPRSKSASRKDVKVLAVSSGSAPPSRKVPSISFGPEDQWFDDLPENHPMVITARVGTGLVKQILVDTGADSNIMFRNVFDALGLRDTDLRTHQHGVVGLGENFIKPDGVVSLPVFIGGGRWKRSLMAEFVVLMDSTTYNLILGRKTINEFGAVICTKLLLMKFVTDDGSVGSIRGDSETVVTCHNASLSLRKKSKEVAGVFLADLDTRVDDKLRPESEGDLEKFRVGDSRMRSSLL